MTEYTFVGNYRGTSGLNWTTLTEPQNGMRAVWGIFVVESIIFIILGLYFEQVISSGTGIRRHPLFFLEWFKKKVTTMNVCTLQGLPLYGYLLRVYSASATCHHVSLRDVLPKAPGT